MVALVIAFLVLLLGCCVCSMSSSFSLCTDVASDTSFGVRTLDIGFFLVVPAGTLLFSA